MLGSVGVKSGKRGSWNVGGGDGSGRVRQQLWANCLKMFLFLPPNLTSKGGRGTIHFMHLKSLSGNQNTPCIDFCPTKEQSFAVFVAEFNSFC